jgi:hypothetical protein
MKTQAWRLAIFHSLPAYKSKLLKPSGMKKP